MFTGVKMSAEEEVRDIEVCMRALCELGRATRKIMFMLQGDRRSRKYHFRQMVLCIQQMLIILAQGR